MNLLRPRRAPRAVVGGGPIYLGGMRPDPSGGTMLADGPGASAGPMGRDRGGPMHGLLAATAVAEQYPPVPTTTGF